MEGSPRPNAVVEQRCAKQWCETLECRQRDGIAPAQNKFILHLFEALRRWIEDQPVLKNNARF
jgi:hypothetical protein